MKRIFSLDKPGVRVVLGLLLGMLLVVISVALMVVLRNVEATNEMQNQAREAVLLSEMDTAVHAVATEVDLWVSGNRDEPDDDRPILEGEQVRNFVSEFDSATEALIDLVKQEEASRVREMRRMFDDYLVALADLREVARQGIDPMSLYHEEVKGIEGTFRGSLKSLEYEHIRHLEESVLAARRAETTMRWLIPIVLVLMLALAAAIRRLSINARRAEAAETLQETRTAFIASVSHELRTPLTAVVGLAHEMRDGLHRLSDSEIEEFAGMIASESSEVTGIVEDLLVAARAEVGDLTVVKEPVDLREQLEKVLLSRHGFDGRQITTVSTENSLVTADAARVRQILRNLLMNAVRYGGKTIEVGIQGAGELTSVWIRDDGPGVPAEDRQRIFKPFQRAHHSPGVPASVGLGLTVSRQLARAMGGDVRYHFDGQSTFELVLPTSQSAPISV